MSGVWGYGIATAATSSGTVTVNAGGTVVTMNAPRDLTLAAGDPVTYLRVGSTWYVLQRYGTAAAADVDNPAPPPPKPVTVTGSKTFTPVETRSRQGSKWRTDNDDVYQGQFGGNGNHTGCAFYGNGPRSLAGATVTGVKVKMRRRNAGGITAAQDTTLWLVVQKTRPSGAPTLGGSTIDGPNLAWGQTTTWTLPDSWGQAMVDGTAGGLAIFESDGSPYVILDGRGRYSASFALTINYTRTL
ncbi:MAG TPA: hypothetical protein VFM50_02890 [Nocardioidaceae bacterium]|nr:hypothetical protein [Nocardioidaceae bacterium]